MPTLAVSHASLVQTCKGFCTLCKLSGLRGLQAADTIAKGETVATIPRSVALWVTDASKCTFENEVDPDFFRKSPKQLKLALLLLHESRLGSSSRVSLTHGPPTS
jgi:hypothetical protein